MEQKPKIALLGMTPDALAEVAAEAGLRRFAAGQMAKWIYDKRVSEIDEMTDLPKQARALLSEKYCIGTYAPKLVTESADGTRKYLFEGAGGRDVEAVYIPDGDRATLCVSSQAGCKMGCTFCMTGRQGFHGNLAASQILNQIFSIPESRSLTNIVFMGMGEPMDNLDEVLRAIDVLTAKWGLGWSPTRITVSTIGKLAEMKRLIETTKVHLAVSVHSPLPSQRAELMPVERAFPMVKIVDLLRKYDFAHQRRLTMARRERHYPSCRGARPSYQRHRCARKPYSIPCHTRQPAGSGHVRGHGSLPRPAQCHRRNGHYPRIARRRHNGGMRHACRKAKRQVKTIGLNRNISAYPDLNRHKST